MTALPVLCRNTKDALRKPLSAIGSRVRRARAERSWVGCALRAFGFPWPPPRLSSRLMRVRREAARPRPGLLQADRRQAALQARPWAAPRALGGYPQAVQPPGPARGFVQGR